MKITQHAAKLAKRFARNPCRFLGGALALSILADWATMQFPVHTPSFLPVPKLQLGNREAEAPASRDWKLELPSLHSQAGTWERVQY